jgi:hypothetical protein
VKTKKVRPKPNLPASVADDRTETNFSKYSLFSANEDIYNSDALDVPGSELGYPQESHRRRK